MAPRIGEGSESRVAAMLPVPDAAARAGIPRSTAYRLVASGRVPHQVADGVRHVDPDRLARQARRRRRPQPIVSCPENRENRTETETGTGTGTEGSSSPQLQIAHELAGERLDLERTKLRVELAKAQVQLQQASDNARREPWRRALAREVREWARVRLGETAVAPALEALDRAIDGAEPGEDEQVREALMAELAAHPRLSAMLLGKLGHVVARRFGVDHAHAAELVEMALGGTSVAPAMFDDDELWAMTTLVLLRIAQTLRAGEGRCQPDDPDGAEQG